MRRGSLKCGGEYYLKEESGQRYRISRRTSGQFLLHRVDRLKTSDAMNYYVPIQQDEACEKNSKYS